MEVGYVGLVELCRSRQCQHLAIFRRVHHACLGTGGSPSGLCLSAHSFWRGFSRSRCLYLLCIPPGYFRALVFVAISLCAFVGLVRRPLSVPVGLLNWRITNTATETPLASLRPRPLSSLSVQLPNRGHSQSKINEIGTQNRSESLLGRLRKEGSRSRCRQRNLRSMHMSQGIGRVQRL
jgi:hypothetical protein